jgi:hypothetical protein
MQTVVALKHSWEKGLEWMMRGQSRIGPYMIWIAIIVIFLGSVAFLTLNPDLLNQAMAATQNPLVDITVIAIFACIVAIVYFMMRRRRRNK